jgi:threonine dehydrogenase-like Zn-dependent dehydrogenase
MRAVTFQSPGEVRVQERPDPELQARDDAIVSIEASGICGSDLHIYHGRVKIEPGFTIGHEFVGTVQAVGDDVTRVKPGDRVLGCFHTACGRCFFCLRGSYQKCEHARVFGHGQPLGALQGTQAEQALVPMADMTLRTVPDGISDDVALFAGDVMGTGYHAIAESGARPGDSVAVLGLGPVGLCAVQIALAAGAGPVFAIDTVAQRLDVARGFGATAVHLTEESPREVIKQGTEGRGVDAAIDAVGHPDALDLAIRLARGAGTVVAMSAAGFHWSFAGENIATGFSTPAQVVRGWMASTGHCQNILNPSFADVGTGVTPHPVSGFASGPSTWTQDFGLWMGHGAPSHDGARPPGVRTGSDETAFSRPTNTTRSRLEQWTRPRGCPDQVPRTG